MSAIYLDHNATTPIHPDVAAVMEPLLRGVFGNPSSSHPFGVEAKMVLEGARRQVAASISAEALEVVFTSGGTESNNLAIMGAASANRGGGNHIITSAIEHPAVSEVMDRLEREGLRVSRLGVSEAGFVDPDDLRAICGDDTILVSIMLANNELGTVQPIAELARIAHDAGALIHTDAAQAIGKIRVDVGDLGVDLLSIAGHKLYAPKGIGALFVKRGVNIERILYGASHERGLRPGTENVLLAAALGKACEVAARDLTSNCAKMSELRDRLEERLLAACGQEAIRVNGEGASRLPNTASISFRGIDAGMILSEISDEVAASAGAACHADGIDVSPTLEAIGLPEEWAMGTIRFSTGRTNDEQDIERAADVVTKAVQRLGTSNTASPQVSEDAIQLTRFTKGLGCACKIQPQYLREILRGLPKNVDERIVVDMSDSDDAAVFSLDDGRVIVQTVDFLTPIVDDPYEFGAIAAANSLSDIYAMGAEPEFALSIVAFPSARLPVWVLQEILRGASDKAGEAGVSIVGGHSVEDAEPKFGLAATGFVTQEGLWLNRGARVGDQLILTKALGTGLISTARKKNAIAERDASEASRLMSTLNGPAMRTLKAFRVNACTDVTGFGLLGHLLEMLRASRVSASLNIDDIPFLDHALKLAEVGFSSSGTLANLDNVSPEVKVNAGVTVAESLLLADAQTSGGLLAAVHPEDAGPAVASLRSAGIEWAAVVGEVVEPNDFSIEIYR